MLPVDDTIVAVSSPPGRAWRGLVRLSGPLAAGVLARIVRDQPPAARHLQPCRLIDPPIPAMLAWFKAPHSYSGQDLAELQLSGNPALLERVLGQALAAGARLAEPGEFTFRAFVAGRLDLTQAEGVAATIAAAGEAQLQAAAQLREGHLGRFATQRVDELASLLALVEAGIDFTDQEDVVPIEPRELARRLTALRRRLSDLLSRCRAWGTLETLPRVVLVGPPSSGKSTLFNALLGRTRAVVSPLPGTTRDRLEEPMQLIDPVGRHVEVLLVDIAGLDTPTRALDRQAQHAARQAIDAADLLLLTSDRDKPDRSPAPASTATPCLRIRTKCDLAPPTVAAAHDLAVSALHGQGLDLLRRLIVHHLGDRAVSLGGDALALQPRHEAALRQATAALDQALALLQPQQDHHAIEAIELVAGALRRGLDALASLGGCMSPDDILGRVFATFCIGK